jgi:uncharacterized protein YegL
MQKINSSQVNHVYFVVDQSGSMMRHTNQVKNVCNALISETGDLIPGVENRVSVYTFNERCSRALTDGDPRFAKFDDYRPFGNTAIVDALSTVYEDIAALRQRCDSRDRTFLVYLVTDGEDNSSRVPISTLKSQHAKLANLVTVAAFVPNQYGETYAKSLGIPHGNIQIWDINRDFSEVKATVTSSMREYATTRSSGQTTSSSLFRPNTAAVQKAVAEGTVAAFTQPLQFLDVNFDGVEIAPFVESKLGRYVKGSAYYQLTKSEQLGPMKNLLIVHRVSGKAYHGPNARAILGIPAGTVRISVDKTPGNVWDVFVQSTSLNRKLVSGTKVIVIK